jgi:hypothetical protein
MIAKSLIQKAAAKSLLQKINNPAPAPVDAPADDKQKRRRGKTLQMRRLSREERAETDSIMLDLVDFRRPDTRAECANMQRPCPFVSCKYHLYLDINPNTGSIKINFPHLEVWEMTETCALDVADRGGITLEDVGEIVNLTRERIRQVESVGLAKLREVGIKVDLNSYL